MELRLLERAWNMEFETWKMQGEDPQLRPGPHPDPDHAYNTDFDNFMKEQRSQNVYDDY